MAEYLLISIFQLLSGISIPLHTVRYGTLKVPIVLHYEMMGDSAGLAVSPGWTLRIDGEARTNDDAGHKIDVTPKGIFWPRGAVNYFFSDGCVKGLTVTDDNGIAVRHVDFETGPSLQAVCFSGHDTTEVQTLTMAYTDTLTLSRITRAGGGSVVFTFMPEGGRMLKRSVCRMDAENRVVGISEYTYHNDSLGQTITETVSDGQNVKRKVVRRFVDGLLRQKETYAGAVRLKSSTSYCYIEGDGFVRLESVSTTSYPEDSSTSPYTCLRRYQYAPGQAYPYPTVVETSDSHGVNERLVYAYPFCPGPNYGPVAEALLDAGMADAILALERWNNDVFQDSTTVVYDAFQAVNAPSGRMYRPSAIVYSSGKTSNDICLKYTDYDAMGLKTSRAKVVNKHCADHLPLEVFRWKAPDPLADLMREQRAYEVCAAWPELNPNQECGDNYLFEGTGAYLGKVEAGETSGCVIADQGLGEPLVSARFSDPDITPMLVDRFTDVALVSSEEAVAKLTRAGAFEEAHRGLFKGIWYLWRESRFDHRLDFATNAAYEIYPKVLYVTEAGPMGVVAHDNYNFGNYLWGAAAREVGVPLWMALFGSHLHAFFSPYTFGHLDSRDDIFSIRAGYHWDGR